MTDHEPRLRPGKRLASLASGLASLAPELICAAWHPLHFSLARKGEKPDTVSSFRRSGCSRTPALSVFGNFFCSMHFLKRFKHQNQRQPHSYVRNQV